MSLHGLQLRLGYTFKNQELLAQALSRVGASGKIQQRMEFLGDRVLGMVIGAWLFERFEESDEGGLSRRLTALVRESALLKVAENIRLESFLTLGQGEELKPSMMADSVESMLGAIWLDGGMVPVQEFIHREWAEMIDTKDEKDAKTKLQEWLQARKMVPPQYEVLEETGPDHDKYFKVIVKTVEGAAWGEGKNKQLASVQAAEKLMANLEKR